MDTEEYTLWPWLRIGYSLNEARRIKQYLIEYKRRLSQGPNVAYGNEAAENLNRARYARRKTQSKRKEYTAGRKTVWEKDVLLRSTRISEDLLDSLFPDRTSRWVPPFDRSEAHKELTLKEFSFIDQPIDTMSLLAEIAKHESFITHGRINFYDPICLDIGPFLILQEMQRAMLPVYRGGRITKPVQQALELVNLAKPLHMEFKGASSVSELWPLPVRTRGVQNRTEERLLNEQTSEIVASEVIEKINEWLGMISLELSSEGERFLLKFIGEALDNAERHSGGINQEGTWSVAGFMRPVNEADGKTYRCHLALLSKGKTISESMFSAPDITRSAMQRYVNKHRKVVGRNGFSVENLETVYALQDGVSRITRPANEKRGGTGFMDLLSFFESIGGSSQANLLPKFSIISGSTCVRIMPPYISGRRAHDSPSNDGLLPPRELWFNIPNSANVPPDPAFVLDLPAKLQGTLITVAWTLDSEFLEKTVNNGNSVQ